MDIGINCLNFEIEETTRLRRRFYIAMDGVQKYRQRAAQARRLAKSVTDPLICEQLEIAARDYDEMADRAEKASTKESSGELSHRIRWGKSQPLRSR